MHTDLIWEGEKTLYYCCWLIWTSTRKKTYSKYVSIAEKGNLISSNISNHIHQTLKPDRAQSER